MKKLALVFASLALAATPVLACPHEAKDNAPQTADKAKQAPKAKEGDKAKDADKTAKPTEKKPDKVSSK